MSINSKYSSNNTSTCSFSVFFIVDRISKENIQRKRGSPFEMNDKYLSNSSSKGTSTLQFSAGGNQIVNRSTFQNRQWLQDEMPAVHSLFARAYFEIDKPLFLLNGKVVLGSNN